jgi:hypothetical protein
MLENAEGTIKMDNPEKLATYSVHKTKENKTIICVGHCYMQTNKNNVNKA